MDSIASPTPRRKIVVGVDTHKHLHVAVALDELVSASSPSARTALAMQRRQRG